MSAGVDERRPRVLEVIEAAQERELRVLREEAGYPDPESGEYATDEQVTAYIEALEAAVVGKAAALDLIREGK